MAIVSLADLTRSRWGTNSRLVSKTVAVSTAATVILKENPRRVGYLIINRSPTAGSLGFEANHAFTDGIYLQAEGGGFGMDYETDGEGVGYAVYGILESGNGDFYVLEVMLQ